MRKTVKAQAALVPIVEKVVMEKRSPDKGYPVHRQFEFGTKRKAEHGDILAVVKDTCPSVLNETSALGDSSVHIKPVQFFRDEL